MRFHDRERDFILCEDVRDREFSAVGIAPVLEIHLPDLIGVCLQEDRHAGILKGRDGTVLIGKDGHRENDTVIFSFMFFEPLGIEETFVSRLDAAVAGQFRIHGDIVITGIGHRLDHIFSGAVDEFSGHEAAVAERQCECHLSSHNDLLFYDSIPANIFIACLTFSFMAARPASMAVEKNFGSFSSSPASAS